MQLPSKTTVIISFTLSLTVPRLIMPLPPPSSKEQHYLHNCPSNKWVKPENPTSLCPPLKQQCPFPQHFGKWAVWTKSSMMVQLSKQCMGPEKEADGRGSPKVLCRSRRASEGEHLCILSSSLHHRGKSSRDRLQHPPTPPPPPRNLLEKLRIRKLLE